MTLSALVFDFDGLIVDTEVPHYQAWCEQYEAAGAELALERWLECVGTHASGFDPLEELERLAAEPVDLAAVGRRHRERFVELVGQQPCRPGVAALVEEAADAGVALGVASSARTAWVQDGLRARGLLERFQVVAGRDRVGRPKPAPDVYELVLAELGRPADEAVALEDSANGIAAARAVGLTVVAVPNRITRAMDLTAAHAVFDTLAGVGLDDLARLRREVRARPAG